jgi:signal transduction histidine kinase
MQLESVARFVDRPEAAARVRRAVDDLATTIREIHSTIYALTSEASSEPTSLRSRFFEVVDPGAEQLGHAPAVRLAGLVDTSVPPAVADHLLAVLREALSNAARHARSSRVEVVLDVGDEVRLTVRDDGRGLPADVTRRSGLAHLEARAAEVGGTFAAGPGPGGGTGLTWRLPCPRGSTIGCGDRRSGWSVHDRHGRAAGAPVRRGCGDQRPGASGLDRYNPGEAASAVRLAPPHTG